MPVLVAATLRAAPRDGGATAHAPSGGAAPVRRPPAARPGSPGSRAARPPCPGRYRDPAVPAPGAVDDEGEASDDRDASSGDQERARAPPAPGGRGAPARGIERARSAHRRRTGPAPGSRRRATSEVIRIDGTPSSPAPPGSHVREVLTAPGVPARCVGRAPARPTHLAGTPGAVSTSRTWEPGEPGCSACRRSGSPRRSPGGGSPAPVPFGVDAPVALAQSRVRERLVHPEPEGRGRVPGLPGSRLGHRTPPLRRSLPPAPAPPGPDSALDGEDVLPGFRMTLAEPWADA